MNLKNPKSVTSTVKKISTRTVIIASGLFLASGVALVAGKAHAQGFSFSKAEEAEKAQTAKTEAERQAKIDSLLQTTCRQKIKNQKIVVLIGENRNGYIFTSQPAFSTHFDAVNTRLQSLGLKTFTQAQIRAQVAQAEIDAYFKNDAAAAMSASKRLAAQYTLRGLITSKAYRNYALNLNQVRIGMQFTLTGANGKVISTVAADDASYAGPDVGAMALTLINERAEELVAQLYADYCKQGSR
jgi:hypothetical protein